MPIINWMQRDRNDGRFRGWMMSPEGMGKTSITKKATNAVKANGKISNMKLRR